MELFFELNTLKDGLVVTGGKDIEGELVIPKEHEFEGEIHPITAIKEWAFSDCTRLTHIVIPSSVIEIGDCAFYRSGLEEVEIPDSVERIGNGAWSCQHLKKIVAHGDRYFSNDENNMLFHKESHHNPFLNKWQFQCGIAAVAYAGITGIVTIPPSITKIEKYSFAECYSLTGLVFHDKVSDIEDCAFYGCKGLTEVSLPYSVTELADGLFEECENLRTIKIPCVQTIGSDCFKNCKKLRDIQIPKSVSRINSSAFENCESLVSIIIPPSMDCIEWDVFKGCTSLEEVVFAKGAVPQIDENAFAGCCNLKRIIIDDAELLEDSGVPEGVENVKPE